jgi:hypothetical protein
MSENGSNFGKNTFKPRSKKLNPKVYFSSMVSISFLLIFYMVMIEINKPKAMSLGMPVEKGC